MSEELPYFPPNKDLKYKWENKTLTYSPWVCNFSKQKSINAFPFRVICEVDLLGDSYQWRVEVTDWTNKRHSTKEDCDSAIEACLRAESVAEVKYQEYTPGWVLQALKNKWRPPSYPEN